MEKIIVDQLPTVLPYISIGSVIQIYNIIALNQPQLVPTLLKTVQELLPSLN